MSVSEDYVDPANKVVAYASMLDASATVDRPIVREVGVTNVVGPPGPAGPRGPAGDGPAGDVELAIETHVQDPTPHPSYDDMPDLTLLFLNGLA